MIQSVTFNNKTFTVGGKILVGDKNSTIKEIHLSLDGLGSPTLIVSFDDSSIYPHEIWETDLYPNNYKELMAALDKLEKVIDEKLLHNN